MRQTVALLIGAKAPAEEQVQRWTLDAVPAIRELQSRLNDQYFGKFTLTTTNTAVFTTVWTSDNLPADGTWRVILEVQARSTTDGSAAFYWLASVWKRVGSGAATQVGATVSVVPAFEDVAGWDVQIVASTNAVVAQVQGDVTRVVSWVVVPYIRELT